MLRTRYFPKDKVILTRQRQIFTPCTRKVLCVNVLEKIKSVKLTLALGSKVR